MTTSVIVRTSGNYRARVVRDGADLGYVEPNTEKTFGVGHEVAAVFQVVEEAGPVVAVPEPTEPPAPIAAQPVPAKAK